MKRGAILLGLAVILIGTCACMKEPAQAQEPVTISSAKPVKVPYLNMDIEHLSIIRQQTDTLTCVGEFVPTTSEENGEDYDEEGTEGEYQEMAEEASEDAEPEDVSTDEAGDSSDDRIYIGTWICTGYCPGPCCCGEYASGYTASGTLATEGRTIASNELDIGTVVYIEGLGEYVVEDTGASPYSQWIDVFFDSHDQALAFGVQEREVYLIQ